ncbi:MAG: hypothetical protein QOF92_893 [Pseudonocardiales bacterium]|nr:hypothetical protein [Pseudonocardiales bacterium]
MTRTTRLARAPGEGGDRAGFRGGDSALVGVVVVNFGSHSLIEANVGGLDLDRSHFRVVVVDNYLDEAERVSVRQVAEAHGWEWLLLPDNRGFGAAANAGARHAAEIGCGTLLFLNPDAIASALVLDELRQHAVREPRSMITPRLRSPMRNTLNSGSVLDLRTGRVGKARAESDAHLRPWLPATCLALRTDLFADIGGFDETYFMYWEDVDLSLRAIAVDARLVVREDLEIVHDSGGTQGPRRGHAKSPLYYRYNCRNRLVFAANRLPRGTVLRWMAFAPSESWRILMQGGRRQLIHSPRPLLAAVAGSVAGLMVAGKAVLGRRPAPPVDGAGARPIEPKGEPERIAERVRVTVAVATFHRRDHLAALLPLLSQQAQQVSADPDCAAHVDILVVDNDPAGSGAELVSELALPATRSVVEAAPGISAARNRALTDADPADVLVFIDDDEQPTSGWLKSLLQTWRSDHPAAVVGPVETLFAVAPEPWVIAGEFFARRSRAETRTGEAIARGATNNLLLDLRQINTMGLRFDERFGISGGGDTQFTTRVAREARMVWCREAVVTELVPAERTTRHWLLSRAFSYGTTDSRVALSLTSGFAQRCAAAMRCCAVGLPRIAVGATRWLVGTVTRSDRQHALGLQTLLRGAGLVAGAFGYSYHRYRRPAAAPSSTGDESLPAHDRIDNELYA